MNSQYGQITASDEHFQFQSSESDPKVSVVKLINGLDSIEESAMRNSKSCSNQPKKRKRRNAIFPRSPEAIAAHEVAIDHIFNTMDLISPRPKLKNRVQQNQEEDRKTKNKVV
jgi:hypothetical protein